MSKILSVLKARWFITLIGAIILSLLVWFLGPLIAIADFRPFETIVARAATIAAILVIWAFACLIGALRRKKANDAIAEGIAAAPANDTVAAESAEEVSVLKERLQEAVGLLKQAKLGGAKGGKTLYQLPWYILIGPPGSGKTTALVNSGLSFPLADKLGRDSIRGVGGTRNCDWWFTDDAVLLDTAGRYTTQDSHREVDSAAWTGFLGLLKKFRPRQPINGALIAISLSDLAVQTETERQTHAREIRKRIRELHDGLGVRFPTYVLFTKADLIAGFVEFFDDQGREEREQVWGMTLPLDDGISPDGAVAAFGAEFDALIERLNDRLVERVHQEPDVQRRSLIFGFPAQVASLKDAAQSFLTEIFQPSRFEERPLLRGIYLTSGTQEGTPIDRLMGAMASTFGVQRQKLSSFSGTGRSYFLTRLLKDVIFAEASLVSANRKAERRSRLIHRGAMAAAILAVVGMGAAWTMSYLNNRNLIDEVNASVALYNEQLGDLDVSRVADSDLTRVLPALNTLRNVPYGYAEQEQPAPISLELGLFQGDKLGSQAVFAYKRGLNSLLLPRLLYRLEDQIRANIDRPEYIYEALKVYLMLGNQGPLDPVLVNQWLALDWATVYPGDANGAMRQQLSNHLGALLETSLSTIPLDGPMIERAQQTLQTLPLAERAYALILQSPAARDLAEWRASENGGPAIGRVFTRVSGRPLSDGIPGIYTYNGFHGVFLPALGGVARDVAAESWVLGPESDIADMSDEDIEQLSDDVMSLYLNDYATRWDSLLADIVVQPPASLTNAVETLNTLSGPTSPLRQLLTAIVRETKLSVPPAADPSLTEAAETASGVVDAAAALGSSTASRLSAVVGRGEAAIGAPPAEDPPGQFIDDRFRPLHDFVGGLDGAPSPMENVIQTLNELYGQLNRMAGAANQGEVAISEALGGSGAAQQLQSDATRLPEPVAGWMSSVATSSSSITVGGARQRLNGIWTAEVLPFCRQAIGNRYPIHADGSADVTLDDFSRLFAPGGMIDSFFTTHLAPFVDTATRPWQWRRVDNVDLGISPGVLVQFQRAAAIRDAFFAGGAAPSVRFEMIPVSLDADATQVLVEIDGQAITYSHGPPRGLQMSWPGQGASQARVSFSPTIPGGVSSVSHIGPWAFFRLLDQSQVSGGGLSDRFTVTFNVGGRTATFELRANSVMNPFTLPELRQFRCPGSL